TGRARCGRVRSAAATGGVGSRGIALSCRAVRSGRCHPVSASPLLSTPAIGLPLLRRGKVRDVFEAGDDQLLIVATDRISAFDHVLGSGIPDKGRILTLL